TGTETIGLHNNSPQALADIFLRLDHNIFRPLNPHAAPWVPAENTDGMVVTRLVVNGETVDLAAPPAGGGGGRGRGGDAAGPRPSTAPATDQTLARISLGTPIAAKPHANP